MQFVLPVFEQLWRLIKIILYVTPLGEELRLETEMLGLWCGHVVHYTTIMFRELEDSWSMEISGLCLCEVEVHVSTN